MAEAQSLVSCGMVSAKSSVTTGAKECHWKIDIKDFQQEVIRFKFV